MIRSEGFGTWSELASATFLDLDLEYRLAYRYKRRSFISESFTIHTSSQTSSTIQDMRGMAWLIFAKHAHRRLSKLSQSTILEHCRLLIRGCLVFCCSEFDTLPHVLSPKPPILSHFASPCCLFFAYHELLSS